ncbi:hypothetical protein ABBQ32_008848 [Trebouxia sp. C0010 RCD-2024]
MQYDQQNMPAMRQQLAQELWSLGLTSTDAQYLQGDPFLSWPSTVPQEGTGPLSPGIASAAETLLTVGLDNTALDITVGQTGHASKRLAANVQLVKHTAKMASEYNKTSTAQVFQVGQTVGLKIPSVAREKLEDRFILCMVIGKKHHGYTLRCEGGLIQGLIATDQLTLWEPAHTFKFTAKDEVGQLKELSIPATRANNQPS